jgi:hypothetical protein
MGVDLVGLSFLILSKAGTISVGGTRVGVICTYSDQGVRTCIDIRCIMGMTDDLSSNRNCPYPSELQTCGVAEICIERLIKQPSMSIFFDGREAVSFVIPTVMH